MLGRNDRIIIGAWLGLVVLQIIREVQAGWMPPRPATFVGGAVVYSGLGIVGSFAPQLAVALAVGIDVAALIVPAVQAGQTAASSSPLNAVTGWVAAISGVSNKPTPAGGGVQGLGGGPDWRIPA